MRYVICSALYSYSIQSFLVSGLDNLKSWNRRWCPVYSIKHVPALLKMLGYLSLADLCVEQDEMFSLQCEGYVEEY